MRNGISAGIGALLLGVGAAHAQTPGAIPVTAFVDVTVIPMDRERVLPHQTVLVQGGHIAALGSAEQVSVPADAVRVDGRGKFLIPGLADMHIHLYPVLPYFADTALTADKLFAYLASGVTTVRDMHGGGPTSPLLDLRRRVNEGTFLAPRIYTAGDVEHQFVNQADSLAARIKELKAAGHDFLKIYEWDRPSYDTAMAAAARLGFRVVGHVPGAVAEALPTALQGWASVEHLTGYVPYLGLPELLMAAVPDSTAPWRRPGYRLDAAKLRTITAATRRAGVWNCPTLSSTADHFAFLIQRDPGFAADTAWLGLRGQIVKALHDAGTGLLLGTDALFSGFAFSLTPTRSAPGVAIHQELQQLVQAGLTPYQALATGTRNVAEFLGTLDSAGTIAVGKQADLVLLAANPLEDIGHTRALAGVMAGGRWLAPATIAARLDTWPAALPAGSSDVVPKAYLIRLYLRQGLQSLWR